MFCLCQLMLYICRDKRKQNNNNLKLNKMKTQNKVQKVIITKRPENGVYYIIEDYGKSVLMQDINKRYMEFTRSKASLTYID